LNQSSFTHLPVLFNELIAGLNLKTTSVVADCTAGGGGHLAAVMDIATRSECILALDRDPDAIAHLKTRFSDQIATGKLRLVQSPFSLLDKISAEFGLNGRFDAIFADLGVSSHQLDTASRGFSFSEDGPLDMRMSYDSKDQTAAELLNEASEEKLADIFFYFGDIRESRRLAREIARFRDAGNKYLRTSDLLNTSTKVLGPKKFGQSHPATRVFQALRIAVNHELDQVKALLDFGLELLAPGGRLAIISFHSLEDRLVKQKFSEFAGKRSDDDLPRELRVFQAPPIPKVKIIKPFPMSPSQTEIEQNSRSRSAKLRIIEKLETRGSNANQ
jgi:16S rRNA (cytosine1402-N4)-methyltransferase